MSKTWRYIDEENVSAGYGLAVDEYLMHSPSLFNNFDASLRLYNYKNYSALCGRFQDINAEIDIEACNTNGFQFGRRLTGGGAIIMGESQLGICVASNTTAFQFKDVRELYRILSQPVIDVLENLNIMAGFRAKNDLEVGGKKIAGLGIYIDEKGGLQFHCSLLLDLNVNDMLKVLSIPIQKYSDKRLIQTIEQRITTIHRESGKEISMNELKSLIAKSYSNYFNIKLEAERISESEVVSIQELENERYRNEEWIFQRSPQKDMTGTSLIKTKAGLLRTYVGLKGENIKSVLITGDFMDENKRLKSLESELKWSPLDKQKIDEVVNRLLSDQEENIDPAMISKAVWTAAQRALAANRYTYQGSCYYPKEEKKSEEQEIEINKV